MWSDLPSLTSRLVVDHCEVGVEFDAVGWVEVDALDLAAEAFAFCEGGHDLERVAEDHAVGPVLVVLVELGFVGVFGDAVEVSEEVRGEVAVVVLAFLGLAEEMSLRFSSRCLRASMDLGAGVDFLAGMCGEK